MQAPPPSRGEIHITAFDRRNMQAQRAAAAEKAGAAKRATEAQILEDAGRLIAAWNERSSAGSAASISRSASLRTISFPLGVCVVFTVIRII